MSRLVAFAVLFVALTLAGAVWAVSRAPVTVSDLRALDLRGSIVLLVPTLCAGIYATDALRYRALGAAVGARVSWRAALDASVANFFFSWITPGSTFGAPATIYMLVRRGVAWDAAVVITFGKAFTGVAVIVLASVALLALGLGPEYDPGVTIVAGAGGAVFASLFALLVHAASRPATAQRFNTALFGWIARRFGGARILAPAERVVSSTIERLSLLRAGGVWPLARLALTHLVYFATFAGLGVVLLSALGGAAGVPSFAALILYMTFTYLAPTPGGAGFAEAMATPFFGPLLPPTKAVLFVLIFRGITLYLQVGFAIPYMLVVGGVGEIASRAARPRADSGV